MTLQVKSNGDFELYVSARQSVQTLPCLSPSSFFAYQAFLKPKWFHAKAGECINSASSRISAVIEVFWWWIYSFEKWQIYYSCTFILKLCAVSASSVPPHVPSCEVPNSVFVGSGLELLCKDKLSVPPATYRWFKDNKALTATADTPYSIDTNKGTLVSMH